MKKILVLGAGAMGSAFTVPCAENKNEISLIGTHLEDELVDHLNKNQLPIYEKAQIEKEKIWYNSLTIASGASLVLMLVLHSNNIIS